MSANMQLLVGVAAIVGYYVLGVAVVSTGVFERSQANPVHDYIYWLGGNKLLWLWPLWLVLWLTVWPFSAMLWPHYVPRTKRYWGSNNPPRN